MQGTSAVCCFGSPILDLTIYKKAGKINERAKETGEKNTFSMLKARNYLLYIIISLSSSHDNIDAYY